jgi:gliding motility-associated-like protein
MRKAKALSLIVVKLTFSVILFLLFSLSTKAQINLSLGLKLYLNCNGNSLDASGNANNAIVSGATLSTDALGNANSAYQFDGIDDFLEIANASSLQITDSISLCAQVYTTGFYSGLCQSNVIITKGDNDFGNGHYSLRFGDAPFDNDCNLFDSTKQNFYGHLKNLGSFPFGAAIGQAGAPAYINKAQWYCVAYTWDGDTVRMFVDGILRFKYQYANQSNGTNNDKIFIGKRNNSTYPFFFNGKLDNIRIYNRALKQIEIQKLCVDCSAINALNGIMIKTTDTSICGVSTFQIAANPLLGGLSFSWQPTTGLSLTNSPTPFITTSNTTSYTLTVTDTNGCSAIDSIKVSVFGTNSTIANAGADATICAGTATSSVQLQGSGGGTYVWQPSADLNSSTLSNPTATPSATTVYTLIVSNGVGCTSSDVVTVNVTPPPPLQLSNTTVGICKGSTATITAVGAASYTWAPNINISSTVANVVTVNPNATLTYTITATSSGGCTSTATVLVQVNELPAISISAIDSICIGDSLLVTISGADILLFVPAIGAVPIAAGQILVTPLATTTYTVTGSSAIGCTNTATHTVHVNQIPVVTLSKSNDINCQNNNATITASNDRLVYTWQPSPVSSSTQGHQIIVSPSATTVYTATVVDGKCMSTATINLLVTSKPLVQYDVPNAFSPNDDGVNDCLKVRLVNGMYNSYSFRVFNRWGQCVFESQDPLQCWYGEHKGQIPENVDTYYYLLQIEDGCRPIKASGTINRIQ